MLSRGEESCGEVGLNSGFSGFFMVGEDMSAGGGNTQTQRGQNKVTLSFNLTIKDGSDIEATVCRKAPEMFGSPNFPSA